MLELLTIILFFRYEVFLHDKSFLYLNLFPFSVNTLVLQHNSGKIVSSHLIIYI